MEKRMINKHLSYCPICEASNISILLKGTPVCELCGNQNILDRITSQIFIPCYEPARTYKASKYTPPMPDRREHNIPYPIIKDRRANGRANQG